jgi:hypothetical protein
MTGPRPTLQRRRPANAIADEQTVAEHLGYARRSNHPWAQHRPVNEARPSVVEPEGSCRELMSEGVSDSTE